LINSVEICQLGKSINGKFKKFNSTHDKILLVANLKSVSIWGLTIKDQAVHTNKLCNILPFT